MDETQFSPALDSNSFVSMDSKQPMFSDCELVEEQIQCETVFCGKVFSVELSEVRLQDGTTASREVVRHSGGAAIVALDTNDNIYLVRQFRCPFSEILLEIPAGKLDMNEDPKTCALRELQEETGLVPNKVESLGVFYPTPGYCSEKLHLFLARDLSFEKSNLDEGEFLNVYRVPMDHALHLIDSGEISDGKTIAAVLKTARRRSVELK